MTETPYIVLVALATFAGPAITQAGKVWRWVDRLSTLVNGTLGLVFAVVCWAVFGDGSTDMLGSMVVLALGGSQLGAMGYTAAKRGRAAAKRKAPRPSGRELGR